MNPSIFRVYFTGQFLPFMRFIAGTGLKIKINHQMFFCFLVRTRKRMHWHSLHYPQECVN